MRPGLTLICITKDQGSKLVRMLESAEAVVDDIVVFDTGSADGSPQLASQLGARVFEIEWPGSFSSALNQAMGEVRTEWTLRLDTDEWLLPNSDPEIRALMHDPEATGYYFIRQDLAEEGSFSESWHVRMWRSDAGLRFEGYIHEHFSDASLEGKKLIHAPIRFMHDGYVGGLTEEKHRRNLALLRKELEERPGEIYYEIELAMTMIALGDRRGMALIDRLADQELANLGPDQPEPFIATLFGTAISHAERGSKRVAAIVEATWRYFDRCPPLLWAVAQAEYGRGNAAGMLRALLRLEELALSGDYDREWTFDGRILGEFLWQTLVNAGQRFGRGDIAERNRRRLESAAR